MRRRTWFTVAIVIGLLSVTVFLAAGSTVATEATTDGTLTLTPTATDAEPGERVPVTFSLNHSGTNVTAYIVDSDPPPGFAVENVSYQNYQEAGNKWLLLLEPGTSQELGFDLRVPENASGSYAMPFRLKTADGVTEQVELTIDTPGERTEKTTSTSPTESPDEDGSQTEASNGTESQEGTTAAATSAGSTSEVSSPGFGLLSALTGIGGMFYLLTRRLS